MIVLLLIFVFMIGIGVGIAGIRLSDDKALPKCVGALVVKTIPNDIDSPYLLLELNETIDVFNDLTDVSLKVLHE